MKKQVILLLLVVILGISAYLGYQSYKKIKAQETFRSQIEQLPDPKLFQWIGVSAQKNGNSTVVLFFHPECEHCQYEARTILAKINAFDDVNLWWISAADSLAITTFSRNYGLSLLPSTYLAHIEAEKIIQTFGSVSVPHIFIYDENGALRKQFKGETRIEAILKYLSPEH